MSKILLELKDEKRNILSDRVNPPLEVITSRLEMRLQIGTDLILRWAWVDTGAPLTMVSKRVWNLAPIRSQIRWLAFPPGVATLALPALNLAGRRYTYRVGHVAMQPFDSTGASLSSVPVTAQFLEDDPIPNRPALKPEVIVGLASGVVNGRFLVVKPDPMSRAAWVTDDYPDLGNP